MYDEMEGQIPRQQQNFPVPERRMYCTYHTTHALSLAVNKNNHTPTYLLALTKVSICKNVARREKRCRLLVKKKKYVSKKKGINHPGCVCLSLYCASMLSDEGLKQESKTRPREGLTLGTQLPIKSPY